MGKKLQKKMRILRWRTQNKIEKAIWGKRLKSRKKHEKEYDQKVDRRKDNISLIKNPFKLNYLLQF